ncbi:MAG: hypothetical protein HKM94_04355, partial [Halobacteria archaeon]|nr:hypothetical protein [Halobacteria archaeon]
MRKIALLMLSSILLGCSVSPSPVLPPVELTSIDDPLYVRTNWNSIIG